MSVADKNKKLLHASITSNLVKKHKQAEENLCMTSSWLIPKLISFYFYGLDKGIIVMKVSRLTVIISIQYWGGGKKIKIYFLDRNSADHFVINKIIKTFPLLQ